MEEAVVIESENDISATTQVVELPNAKDFEVEGRCLESALNGTSHVEEQAFVHENVEEKQEFQQVENGKTTGVDESVQPEEPQKENVTSTQKTSQPNLLKLKSSSKRHVQTTPLLTKVAQLSIGKGPSRSSTKAESDDVSKRRRNMSEYGDVDANKTPSSASNGALPRSPCIGGARTNYTVPQPFALATDKRASLGNRPVNGDVKLPTKQPGSGYSPTFSTKKAQISPRIYTKPSLPKEMHVEAVKSSKESKSVGVPEAEQVTSMLCSPSSPSKSKEEQSSKSMIGFSFKCDERAERRKEFYSKLEEKLSAKEAEKHEIQAKTQEEMEAEIKELRKSLTFKAKPMPSFYQEAPPPKAELKKIPPTRAKSPKLGRRKSINGVVGNENGETKSDDAGKSLDIGKSANFSTKISDSAPKPLIKKALSKTLSDKAMKLKSEGGFGKGKNEGVFSSAMGADDCFDEVTATKVEEDAKVSSQASQVETVFVESKESHLSDLLREDTVLNSDCIQEVASKNGTSVSVNEMKGEKNSGNLVLDEVYATPTPLGVDPVKLKANKGSQHTLNSEGQEANEKLGRSSKRERLKASTPTFSSLRREQTRVGSARSVSKSNQGLSSTNTDVAVVS